MKKPLKNNLCLGYDEKIILLVQPKADLNNYRGYDLIDGRQNIMVVLKSGIT